MVSARRKDRKTDDVPYNQYKVGPTIRESIIGWAPLPDPLPSEAKALNLLVHGLNVDEDNFKQTIFPMFAKRLYWAEHPILIEQEAYTVGLSWPGDINGWFNKGLYFPEDEFTAFQAGVPLAKFIRDRLASPSGNRKLNILAHSLGNLMMHGALKQLGTASGLGPIRYVMNEAAFSAETFSMNYELATTDTKGTGIDLLAHAVDLGYKPTPTEANALTLGGYGTGVGDVDKMWRDQWEEIQGWRDTQECPVDPNSPYDPNNPSGPPRKLPACEGAKKWFADWERLNRVLLAKIVATPAPDEAPDDSPEVQELKRQRAFFTTRWALARTSDAGSRGPWRGIFESNLAMGGDLRIYNTYNPGDWVLRTDRGGFEGLSAKPHAWFACQQRAKPYNNLPDNLIGPGADNLATNGVRWPVLDAPDMNVFGHSLDDPQVRIDQDFIWNDGADHSWETRGWAELAYWYPAMAAPVGVQEIAGLEKPGSPKRNVDMRPFGAGDEKDNFVSHGYLESRGFSRIYSAFRAIREKFQE